YPTSAHYTYPLSLHDALPISRVPEIVLAEEKRFASTLDKGLEEWEAIRQEQRLEWYASLIHQLDQERPNLRVTEEAKRSKDMAYMAPFFEYVKKEFGPERFKKFRREFESRGKLPMPGDAAFRLYDTYGL